MLFINTLKAPFINHIMGSTTKSFADIVTFGEMIENTIRCGKIEVGKNTRRSAPKKRENKVSNVSSGYSKPVTVNQSIAIATGQQVPPRREPNTKQNTEKLKFTPIPMTYGELYKSLFDAYVVSPFYLKLMQPPYPKWYDTNTQCEYYVGIVGHSIENYTSFKRLVERLIKVGVVKFDNAPGVGNSLPNHIDNRVNEIFGGEKSQAKHCRRRKSRETRNYCEFHDKEDYEIQRYSEFRALVQGLMDNKELEFFEFTKREDVCTTEGGSIEKVSEVNHPVVIISQLKINEVRANVAPRVVIQKPVSFPFKDSKRVPWNYSYNVVVLGEESSVSTPNKKAEPIKSLMTGQGGERSKPLVNEPVIEKEADEFLKFLKHSEYSVVE
ncbi:hypothetical protein J1N35_034019 [Gossypium stocksii]|uniref:Uncharacterized protein n=1 Tax=Gossypium stocksii TaxID=47602 RepID=A0A9D3UT56_9ROSI|nr:hypothetical protein J1N35_034019 [Gossypium stocksii]